MYQNFLLVIRFIFFMIYVGANLRLSYSVGCLEPQPSRERCWRLENPSCNSYFVSNVLCV